VQPSPCPSLLPVLCSTPIETPPQRGFKTLQKHFLATKIVDVREYKVVIWVPSQCCTADPIRRFGRSKGGGLSWWVRALIVMMHNDPSSFVRFSNFPKTSGKQTRKNAIVEFLECKYASNKARLKCATYPWSQYMIMWAVNRFKRCGR